VLRSLPRTPPAFTLVEMLAVAALVVTVMLFAIPAVHGVGRAQGLASGGNKIANLLGNARQQAMSRNILTAAVVITGTRTEADYRTVGLFFYGPQGQWLQSGAWETLPLGVTIDPQDLENSTFLENSPPLPTSAAAGLLPLRFHERDLQTSDYACRIFLPNGALSNPEQPAQLRLVEGTVDTSAGHPIIRYERAAGRDGIRNYYDVAIVGTTGALKISRP